MDSPRTQSTLSNSPLPPLPHRRVSNPLRYSSEHSHPLSPPRRNDIGGGSGSSSARRDADITVPEWQPDAAAKQCPICTSAFTFFNRRHHCRKCGRVVCATCSPHRITIPSAYVVRPPPIPVIDLTSSSPGRRTSWILPPDSDGDSNDGSEGSSVRICEDCITPSPVETPTSRNRRRRQSTQGSRSAPPQFQETDYCPICHRALPYLPDPSEQGREAHVASCLAPLTRGRSYTNGGRMVVWNAGAKDTIDPTTGDPIECVICFEEFEEGTEIARLECFCRYHKKCIRDWFDRKGNGECPVHAVHE